MILEKLVRHVKNEGRRLTLDDPSGWNTGGPLFGGRELQAMKLPAVNACIIDLTSAGLGSLLTS